MGVLADDDDTVLHVALQLRPHVVDSLRVALSDLAVREDPRSAEDRQNRLTVQLAVPVQEVRIVGLIRDILDGLRKGDTVLGLEPVLRLASTGHQDVHAIISGHDILPLFGTGLSGYSINLQPL